MTKEEIIQAISDDKLMPFIQSDHLAQIVDFVIKNYHPSLPSDIDAAANRQAALEEPYKWEEEQDDSFGVTPLFVMSNIRSAFKAGAEWQREHDDNLPSELCDYILKLHKQFPEVSFAKLSRICVRVARWQKHRDQETIELAEDHAMLAGMMKEREQMLENAIDGITRPDDCEIWVNLKGYDCNYKDGDKIKLIIIKEEEK